MSPAFQTYVNLKPSQSK